MKLIKLLAFQVNSLPVKDHYKCLVMEYTKLDNGAKHFYVIIGFDKNFFKTYTDVNVDKIKHIIYQEGNYYITLTESCASYLLKHGNKFSLNEVKNPNEDEQTIIGIFGTKIPLQQIIINK